MLLIFFSALALLGISCSHKTTGSDLRTRALTPQAAQLSHKLVMHGDEREDFYYWLKDRENPNVLTYLKAENTYTEQIMAPVQDLENRLFEEMKSRTQENDSTAPVKRGEYFYYSRLEKGLQYPIYARKKGSLFAAEEILLNVNDLAKGSTYCETPGPIISPDQQIMAYATDMSGRRFYTIHFKNLKTNQMLSQTIENVTPNLVWAADSQTVFYTQQNKTSFRSEKIFRYNLNTQKSKLVFFEKDNTFGLSLSQSLTHNYIYLTSSSTLTSEVHYLPSNNPKAKFKLFWHRERGHDYSVTDGEDAFYIVSNKNAKNYKLLKTDFHHTALISWQEIVPSNNDIYINDVTVFKNYLVLNTCQFGLTRIQIHAKDNSEDFPITFNDPNYLASVGQNAEYDTNIFRYEYESMRIPESTIDFNITTKTQEIKKIRSVPNFNQNLYTTERVFITSRDGKKVPVSLLMKKGTLKNNKAPLLLYGYGSYGSNMDPWFNQSVFSLVDRGFVYGIAHIRGGAELGRDWYDQGRTENKKNTFNDFIDCTEGLVKLGYVDSKHIYAMGGSAGGLLMGAVANMRPELYKGIIAQVPFVDVLTTMLDEDIPLTTGEYDEWGDPHSEKDYAYIKSYSPYDNVAAQAYPNILVTTGLNDSQVQYWEPAKWVAKLRKLKTNSSLILLKTNLNAGHEGSTGRFDQLKDNASEFAFILLVDKNY